MLKLSGNAVSGSSSGFALVSANNSAYFLCLRFLGEEVCSSTDVNEEISARSLIAGLSFTSKSGSDLEEGYKPSLLSASATMFLEP